MKFLPPGFIGDNSQTPDSWATWGALLLPYIEGSNQYAQWDVKYLASTQPPEAYQFQIKTYLCSQTPPLANSSFGGPHPGVCQFVLCDGSVRPISIDIDLQTLTGLVTRSGGEPVGKF